jgi:hypothetical protein
MIGIAKPVIIDYFNYIMIAAINFPFAKFNVD